MASNIFISFFLAYVLQYLWGMVNSLQVIMLGALFNILEPVNSKALRIEILKACAFDFFYTQDLYEAFFGFKETKFFSDSFEEAEIGGQIFIVGIGPIFIFMTSFGCFILLSNLLRKFCFGKCKNRCFNWLVQKRDVLLTVSVFFIEGGVELGLTCFVFISLVSHFRKLILVFCALDQ